MKSNMVFVCAATSCQDERVQTGARSEKGPRVFAKRRKVAANEKAESKEEEDGCCWPLAQEDVEVD